MNVILKKPPLPLMLLFILYGLVAIFAIVRSINIHAVDLFTLGVIPVMAGLIIRSPWAGIVFKLYLVLQTLGFAAFGMTALIAYQLTPEDVKVIFNGHNIPMPYLIPTVCIALIFQYWIAFSRTTKNYLTN